jgi:hypothetical protein
MNTNLKTEHPVTRVTARQNNFQNEFLKQIPEKDIKFSSVIILVLVKFHYFPNFRK